jgi:hypothetical protein
MSHSEKKLAAQAPTGAKIIPHYELEAARRARPYRTPQSTIDAFWYVVREYEEADIKKWLDEHPRDRAYLLELAERKYAKQ